MTTWKWNAVFDLWFGVPGPPNAPPKVVAGRVKQLKPLFPFTEGETNYWSTANVQRSLIYRFVLSNDFPLIRDVSYSDAFDGRQCLVATGEDVTKQYWIILQTQRVFAPPGNTLDYTIAFCLLKGLVFDVPIT
jgi:hypothetical protein